MRKRLLLLLCVFLSVPGFVLQSQTRATLSGHVSDAQTGEMLIGANVFVPQLNKGATTNVYGFYSLTVDTGHYFIRISYLGYETQEKGWALKSNQEWNAELTPAARKIDEIVVEGTAADHNIRAPEMSVAKIGVKEIKTIPVIFGELDVLKTIQLLPGIQSAGEGSSGFYVRGGDASQNLILLDEAPVYNASHLLGFFSVFNSDAVKDVTIYKGGFPADYGGRLSSVLDVKMKEGNSKKTSVSGGLGLISSRLMIEGPLVGDKASFIATGRRTYADLFLKLSPDTLLNNNRLYFYDFNLKANFKAGNHNRFYLSGYFGRDVFKFRKIFGFDWGNTTATLRWNHLFSDKLFLNSTFIYSDYDYDFTLTDAGSEFTLTSSIHDVNWKEDFQLFIASGNTLKFGLANTWHRFNPGEITATGDLPVNNTKMEIKHALEQAVYVSHELDLFPFFSMVYGLRYSLFSQFGPGHVFSFNDRGDVIDTSWVEHGRIIKTWSGLEPRLLVNLKMNEASSLKASLTRNVQYLHLLSNSTASTPVDLWVPSSKIIRPQVADQVAMGYFRNFRNNMFESSLELYYKDMKNQIDYRNGADIFLNDLVESQLVFGRGWSYGAELLIRKNEGRLHGWASYTLSRTERKFARINEGRPYPARQDRTHDVSIVGMLDLNDRWTFSAIWVFNTGDAVTFPSGKYFIEGQVINYYTERNGYRMPPYHRMDIGVTLYNKPGKKYQSSLNLSVYNLYARKNAYSISFEQDEDNPAITRAKMIYLFSIVPSITYNFRF
jgi:hypothetical protein